MINRRDILFVSAAMATVACARADSFPSKPVRIIVPYPPGGAVDVLTRLLGAAMERAWGQPVIVESRPGGGTVIGTSIAAKAPPDGYTLLCVANSLLINAKLHKNLPYDSLKAFTPIAIVVDSPQVFVVNSTSNYRTLRNWLDAARNESGGLSIGTVGPATSQHLAAEMLKRAARVEATYVPFAGGPAALNALLGGHIDGVIANLSEVMPHVEAGKLRALAVATPQRVEPLKDVPTVAESGYPGYEVAVWFGYAAPAATPAEVVTKIARDLNAALSDASTLERLLKIGMFPAFKGPAAARDYLAQKYEQFGRVIDEAGIKLDS